MSKQSIGEIVRKMESDDKAGNVTISDYVTHNMREVLNTISAYLNSKHISGEYDSVGREKPFPNIVVGAANIWQRATEVDRKNFRIKAKNLKSIINSFLATAKLQEWMDRENFGMFLNDWGRALSRYGSAILEFVEQDGRLIPSVLSWDKTIVDPIDFENNPKIKILELTEAQLYRNPLYDKKVVEQLCDAKRARETATKKRQDTKNDFIRVYEVHLNDELELITGKEADSETYVDQMHVVAFVGTGKKDQNREEIYEDFTLYKGREKKCPMMITHLIKEEGRTLSIGAVEHLFQAQWMTSHTVKNMKDQLDLASKLGFQTSDPNFVGMNVISDFDTGDILIHGVNQPLTQLNNSSHDIETMQAFQAQWKALGNEITGISEAMLGAAPKSGTAWRQTEALLQESYSLFELMTENKLLYGEQMLRQYIIPFIKTQLDSSDEVVATLDSYGIDKIESKYIKNTAVSNTNKKMIDMILNAETFDDLPNREMQQETMQREEMMAKENITSMGDKRFLKPSEVTWKKQFKDFEWEAEVDMGGSENKDYQAVLATLSTALQVVMNPAYAQNKQAQMVVNEILNNSGVLSPIQLSQFASNVPVAPTMAGESSTGTSPKLEITSEK